jgi:hypothetical protein
MYITIAPYEKNHNGFIDDSGFVMRLEAIVNALELTEKEFDAKLPSFWRVDVFRWDGYGDIKHGYWLVLKEAYPQVDLNYLITGMGTPLISESKEV